MPVYTDIYSSSLPNTHWVNGLDTINGIDNIRLPCIWHLDPAQFVEHFGDQIPHILSEAELLRGKRFHQQIHTERFATGHAALRILLSQLLNRDPAAITFAKGHHNKPLLGMNTLQPIHFNLSYTSKRVMIAIDTMYPIGIDIEWVNETFDYNDMLEACFSKREIDYIHSVTTGSPLRFFTLWTRKEAILKLTGEGIGEHLPSFEVLDGHTKAAKHLIGGNPPNQIHIYTFGIEHDYIGSIASERPETTINFYKI